MSEYVKQRGPNVLMARQAYPIAIIEDRYSGVYSGGEWIALARADEPEFGGRIVKMLTSTRDIESPWSDDVSTRNFWFETPDFIAVGATPEKAVTALLSKGWWRDHGQAGREIAAVFGETGKSEICPSEVAKRLNPEFWPYLLGQVLAAFPNYTALPAQCVTPEGTIIKDYWRAESLQMTSRGVELCINGESVIVRIRRLTGK